MKHTNALNKKAITALPVKLLQHTPIAVNAADNKKSPIYDPAIPPESTPPVDNEPIV